MRAVSHFLLSLLACLALPSWGAALVSFEIVERVGQDPNIFTQGFEIDGDYFYQSSGLYGKSFILRFDATENSGSQSNTKRLDVPPNIFAEGLTIFNNKLFLLSWQASTAWRFDPQTLQLEKTYHYAGEGWGLSHDDTHLIMSDGSDTLKVINPENFSVVKTITVEQGENTVDQLNELEYVDGIIWANRWKSTLLYGIDPESGAVLFTTDIKSLQQEAAVNHIDSVANGIAYDKNKDGFWVTGKYWQYRYLIKLALPE